MFEINVLTLTILPKNKVLMFNLFTLLLNSFIKNAKIIK